jgi:hypothetical protein
VNRRVVRALPVSPTLVPVHFAKSRNLSHAAESDSSPSGLHSPLAGWASQVAAPVPPCWGRFFKEFQQVSEHPTGGISGVDPLRAIDLVWTLRDIKARRTLLPPDPDHLRELIELGLVEVRDDVPALTNKGHEVLD